MKRIGMMRGGLASLMLAGTALLAACGGGGSSSGTAQVRMVNATVGVSAMDLYTTDTLLISGVGSNAASAYKDAATGSYTIKATNTGSATALSSASPSFDKDTAYTVVTWGLAGATQTFYFPDNEAAPSAGLAKVRLFNTALDAGALDLYLTASDADLGSATPVVSAISGSRFSGYSEVTAGTYRLRVTANGSKTDVRLDLPAVTLTALDVLTLITQPSQSGMLVHGLQMLQKGAVTASPNTQARVRLVASVAGNGAVTANVGASSLNVGLPSPSVGSYVLVPAGSQLFSGQVSGNPLATETHGLLAGGDYTLLAYGTLAAPKLSLITDDNRLPSSSTSAKMRLINGVSGQGGLTMAVDFSAVANNVAVGGSSDFALVPSNSAARIDVTSGLSGSTLYSSSTTTTNGTATTINILQQGVYTLFMLDGAASPSGALRRER
nr:DUF4397 domain-containing protein [uncultured Roseateles sp.]